MRLCWVFCTAGLPKRVEWRPTLFHPRFSPLYRLHVPQVRRSEERRQGTSLLVGASRAGVSDAAAGSDTDRGRARDGGTGVAPGAAHRTGPGRGAAAGPTQFGAATPTAPRIRPRQVISIRAEGVAAFAARPVQNPATSTAPFASLAPVAEVGLEGNNSWSTCRVVYKTGMFCS